MLSLDIRLPMQIITCLQKLGTSSQVVISINMIRCTLHITGISNTQDLEKVVEITIYQLFSIR